jgi:hypothetical protein
VPAILRRGEPVFKSMEHARQVVGGGGTTVNVNIVNNAGVEVTTKERSGPAGVSLDVIIDHVVSQKLGERGTASNNAIRQSFGSRTVLKSR